MHRANWAAKRQLETNGNGWCPKYYLKKHGPPSKLLYNLHTVYKHFTGVDGSSKSVINTVFLTSPFRPLSAVQRLMSYKPNKCFILTLSVSDLERCL